MSRDDETTIIDVVSSPLSLRVVGGPRRKDTVLVEMGSQSDVNIEMNTEQC